MNFAALLLPTDFSENSEAAGLVAREIARRWGARLHIAHVVSPLTDPADAAARLTRLSAVLGEGLRVETALLSGRVGRQIIDYARDKKIGLIVLGTHGRTGVSRALLGSVAESVVRLAPCPVLTVPGDTLLPGPGEVAGAEPAVAHRCIVCARDTEELVCEACRVRIRGEALERKIEAERPGRRGAAV